MSMTREEFKRRWESDESGGGITMDEVADCAQAWGIADRPKIRPMQLILYQVLKAADVSDAEEYKPEEE